MPTEIYNSIEEEISALKKKRNAVILAHNYQLGEIQDIADFTGDSLGLSQKAQASDADVIVFSGVVFMAETASILCPDKTVLVPDLEAGCSLAAMIQAEDVRKWKAEHPKGVVVAYVNTTAAVKAESDYCCTSTNAVQIVQKIPSNKEILFIPDFYLGTYVKTQTKRENITLWKGYCHVHDMIKSDQVEKLKREHAHAELLMHPECGCLTKSMHYADRILSTEGMVQYASQSKSEEFIVATETGILHRMKRDNPRKSFIPAASQAVCQYMKQNTLEKIVLSLERLQHEIRVPEPIRTRALRPLERMLEMSASPNGNAHKS
jgi:quinolinate synthase